MRRSAAGLVLAALLCVSVCVTVGVSAPVPPAPAAEPVRILVVGDSITQGSSGDWTWRYRLWQHLVGHDVPVDLVGPRDDLWDYLEGRPGDQRYADPAFDRDHAARWGMAMSAPDHPVGELVEDYRPDVVVELLGANDLAFLGRTPDDLVALVRDLVADARAADPDVDVVLGRVPLPWREDVATYNDRLGGLAAELTTDGSRVVVATADAGYDLSQDTVDGAHPNAHGELKIAAAVEDALASLGVGPPATRPLPTVPRGPVIPPVLSVALDDHAATLTWLRAPGSATSEVWRRDRTAGGGWQQIAAAVGTTHYAALGLPGGHRFEFQTRPLKGFWIAESPTGWSNVVAVDVPPDAGPPVPDAPDAVTGVHSRARRHGEVRTAALPVAGATSYTLRVATAARCRREPAAVRFVVQGYDLPQPRRVVHADAHALWVRWSAVGPGGESPVGPGSTACVRLRG